MSYGCWFGPEVCRRRQLDPDVAMAHREFLGSTEFVVPPYPRAAGITVCGVYRPFPKLWLVNPDDRSQIVCDYELSRWAVALGLARCRRRSPTPVTSCQTLFLGPPPPRSPAPTHDAAGHDGCGGGGGDGHGNGTPGRAALVQ